jgi:hypothetical protein
MNWIMAIGIQPESSPKARLLRHLLLGRALEVGDQPAVTLFKLPQYIGERKVPFQFRHLGVEGINAAV